MTTGNFSTITIILAIVTAILTPIIPTLFLIVGGQRLLNRYRDDQNKKEQDLALKRAGQEKQYDLLRAVRERQYEAIESLYHLFSVFMVIYRESQYADFKDLKTQKKLIQRAIEAEAGVDALILRIGCEFAPATEIKQEDQDLLGHLRQSVKLWRKTLEAGESLNFRYSDQDDYVRFKESFTRTAMFMVRHIHEQLVPTTVPQDQAQATYIVMRAFDNEYERAPYKSLYTNLKKLSFQNRK